MAKLVTYVNFLNSDDTLAVLSASDLTGQDWDVGRISREEIFKVAHQNGFDRLSGLTERVEPTLCLEQGVNYFSADSNLHNLNLVRKRADSPRFGFANLNESCSLLIDSTGRAYTALGLAPHAVFDGRFSVFIMQSPEEVMWAWAWLNFEKQNRWVDALTKLAATSAPSVQLDFEQLIPTRRPKSDYLDKLRDLAHQVNTEIWDEEEGKSSYSSRGLKPGSRWHLTEPPKGLTPHKGMNLGGLVKEILPGRTPRSEEQGDSASTGGKWIRTGRVTAFLDSRAGKLVMASPGDVVTPSIGLISQARVVEEPMAVAQGHYLLTLNEGVDPVRVADFLNSRFANQLRRHAAQSGTIPYLAKSELLKFVFVDTIDPRSALRALMDNPYIQ